MHPHLESGPLPGQGRGLAVSVDSVDSAAIVDSVADVAVGIDVEVPTKARSSSSPWTWTKAGAD